MQLPVFATFIAQIDAPWLRLCRKAPKLLASHLLPLSHEGHSKVDVLEPLQLTGSCPGTGWVLASEQLSGTLRALWMCRV